MKGSQILKNIVRLLLEISAIFAEKIKIYNEKQIINYELIIVLIYNSIFGALLSIFGSFFMALILFPFTKNLYSDWYTILKIFITMNCLMLLVNLLSKKLNIPMMFLQVIFFLKNKFKSFEFFLFYFGFTCLILVSVAYILNHILYNVFIKYGVQDEISAMCSIIISVGLTVAGFYSFPVKKEDRDINELIVSPIFIAINLVVGYKISKQNILSNATQGNEDMVTNLLILFVITACIQVITYLKKFFEQIHQLSGYEKDINVYTKKAKERLKFVREYYKDAVTQFNQVIKDFKSIKKDRRFYIMFIALICFPFIIEIGMYNLTEITSLSLDKSVIKILSYIVLFGFLIFLSIKFYTILTLLLKGKKDLKKRKRVELFGLSLFIFGIIILIVVRIFSIRIGFNLILVSEVCFMVTVIIFGITSIIDWLFRKQEENENTPK